jgi:hypothetical protein
MFQTEDEANICSLTLHTDLAISEKHFTIIYIHKIQCWTHTHTHTHTPYTYFWKLNNTVSSLDYIVLNGREVIITFIIIITVVYLFTYFKLVRMWKEAVMA